MTQCLRDMFGSGTSSTLSTERPSVTTASRSGTERGGMPSEWIVTRAMVEPNVLHLGWYAQPLGVTNIADDHGHACARRRTARSGRSIQINDLRGSLEDAKPCIASNVRRHEASSRE